MENLFKLLKNHKLAETLMADQDFVDGAKKMFKEENIELNDEKLRELLDQTEDKLNSMPDMQEATIENVSGGGRAAAIHAVTTVAGAVIGGTLGVGVEFSAGSDAVCMYDGWSGNAAEMSQEDQTRRVLAGGAGGGGCVWGRRCRGWGLSRASFWKVDM